MDSLPSSSPDIVRAIDSLTQATRDSAISSAGITLEDVYPVGSVYINATVSTNPGTLLGFGTWTAFGSGRTIVGLDSGQTEFDTLGETGGAKTHTLTSAEIPAHTHPQNVVHNGVAGSISGRADWSADATNRASFAQGVDTGINSGGGGAHNNLQPYIVVYMWQRTA